jgi:hypothetical protein
MTGQVLTRLRSMPPEELRFRFMTELRKAQGRVRSAAFTPAWRREKLAALLEPRVTGATEWPVIRQGLADGEFQSAHRAFARHFSARASAFPLNARDVPDVAAAIARDIPGAHEHAMARGERVLAGSYDLLGYRGLELGAALDWHRDPVHGRRAPVIYWADVPYLDAAAGDHKIIWELNRHQHWLLIGRAYALSRDPRFYRAFVAQLESWLQQNPPLTGTNWASMLELAFRAISWLWALEIFAAAAGGADDDVPWIVDLLLALDRQLTHIEHNLSRYFSPNTHLSGEALALYVAGCALPELRASARRAALGRDVLLEEASRQIRLDGGHVELSAHYHRYSTDFYLLAARVARLAGDAAAPTFEAAARTQARYLRAICDNAGIRPQLGDDDGGELFPIRGGPVDDCRHTLGTAAALLNDPAIGLGPVPEEAYWLCGTAARAAPPARATAASVGLTASGYYVSRTGQGDHLIFDAGPHGFLSGGHAHADALSCTLTVGGHPVLIDPGTATYTMDGELRDRFRSSPMHNTVALDGRSQSEPRDAFQWASTTTADAPIWRPGRDADYVEGTHAAYAPHRHTRAILSVHGVGWWFLDHVLGPPDPRALDAYWHIHPSWRVTGVDPHMCSLTNGSEALALASTAPIAVLAPGDSPLAVRSSVYGVIEPAPVVVGSLEVRAPATVATFIPATAAMASRLTVERVELTRPPGPGWHASAFQLRWSGGSMLLLAAIETTGVATRTDAAPSNRWGTAEVQTDARVALLIDNASSSGEAIVINGAMLSRVPDRPMVVLPHRTPIQRLPQLARTVHEVDV